MPLTEGQLRSKRDEFWDTAPAFEGRKEIWDALKAAAYALETGDHTLAQAIVDGANISLPNGKCDVTHYYTLSFFIDVNTKLGSECVCVPGVTFTHKYSLSAITRSPPTPVQ